MMTTMSSRLIFRIVLGLVVIYANSANTSGAEIKVWTARALATVLIEIGPEFERATGHKLVAPAVYRMNS